MVDCTILVVDDEDFVLDGFTSLIANIGVPAKVLTAANGLDALRLVESEYPDIVISDIRMPIMDGLEFCERARKAHPRVHIVFISGYEDFQYAKKAIALGAVDYILKPIDHEAVGDLLKTLYSRIERDRTRDNEESLQRTLAGKQALIDLIRNVHASSNIVNQADLLPVVTRGAVLAVMTFDDEISEGGAVSYEKVVRLHEALDRLCNRVIDEHRIDGLFTELDAHEYVFLLQTTHEHGKRCLLQIIHDSKDHLSIGAACGIGHYINSFEELSAAYQAALVALTHSRFGRNHEISDHEDLIRMGVRVADEELDHQPYDFWVLRQYIGPALSCLDSSDLGESRRLLEDLIEISNVNGWSDQKLRIYFDLFAALSGFSLPHTTSTYELRIAIFDTFTKEFVVNGVGESDSTPNKKEVLVEHAKHIVSSDVKNASLQYVADRIGVSSIYLSQIFREVSSKKFKDYCIECKVDRAKRLLLEPDARVYRVSEETGYSDPKHFTTMFKRATGLTPTEYRLRNGYPA